MKKFKKDAEQINKELEGTPDVFFEEGVLEEIKKCKNSSYYFATKYLTVQNHNNQCIPFKTSLTEKEFNKMFKGYESKRNFRIQ